MSGPRVAVRPVGYAPEVRLPSIRLPASVAVMDDLAVAFLSPTAARIGPPVIQSLMQMIGVHLNGRTRRPCDGLSLSRCAVRASA